jgi:hypothetical protein
MKKEDLVAKSKIITDLRSSTVAAAREENGSIARSAPFFRHAKWLTLIRRTIFLAPQQNYHRN